MSARIDDKILEIEKYLSELAEISPADFEAYSEDMKTKAACERYFERVIEAIVDLGFLVIKEKGLKIPEEDKELFDIFLQENIISQKLAEKLKAAKGMRNILAHDYGIVDDKIVFKSITEELIADAKSFIKRIRLIK